MTKNTMVKTKPGVLATQAPTDDDPDPQPIAYCVDCLDTSTGIEFLKEGDESRTCVYCKAPLRA